MRGIVFDVLEMWFQSEVGEFLENEFGRVGLSTFSIRR